MRFFLLRLGPAAVCHLSHSLSEGDEPINGEAFEGLHKSVWPVYVEADRSTVSEPKMKSRIVARIKAGLTQDALSLRFPAVMCKNASADRASIGLNSLKFDLNPILFSAEIIAQKRGILIQI